jgi:hypothetical protein
LTPAGKLSFPLDADKKLAVLDDMAWTLFRLSNVRQYEEVHAATQLNSFQLVRPYPHRNRNRNKNYLILRALQKEHGRITTVIKRAKKY